MKFTEVKDGGRFTDRIYQAQDGKKSYRVFLKVGNKARLVDSVNLKIAESANRGLRGFVPNKVVRLVNENNELIDV